MSALLPGVEGNPAAHAIRRLAPPHLLSDVEFQMMRASLTELAGLGIALQASVSDGELRVMVAESVRRALGAP